jgi:hypothetical protein
MRLRGYLWGPVCSRPGGVKSVAAFDGRCLIYRVYHGTGFMDTEHSRGNMEKMSNISIRIIHTCIPLTLYFSRGISDITLRRPRFTKIC